MSPRRREVRLRIPLPRFAACTVGVGTGVLGAGLVHGTIPADPALVWPLVTLTIASMAYDLGNRALRRRED